MRAAHAASRRHGQRQAAVVVGLVGASLVLLAGGLARATGPAAGDSPTVAAASRPRPAAAATGAATPGRPTPTAPPPPTLPTTLPTTLQTPVPQPAPQSVPPPVPGRPHPRTPVDAVVARPGSVEIPAIGLLGDLVDLGLDESRHLEVPSDPDEAGWYVHGPRPGEDGPAVVAGHVDSTDGPGVFWRLRDVEPGDEVRIRRVDGTVATFVVDRIGRWPKSAFPTEAVYRRADGPELRLITCGGPFDAASGSYVDNVVVFASLRAST